MWNKSNTVSTDSCRLYYYSRQVKCCSCFSCHVGVLPVLILICVGESLWFLSIFRPEWLSGTLIGPRVPLFSLFNKIFFLIFQLLKEVNEMPLCRFSLQLSNIQTNITRHSNQISCELLVTHKANSFLCILPGSYYLTYFVLVFRSFRWRAIRFCWPSLKCYKVSGMDVAGLLRLLPSHSLATSLGTNVQLLVM